MCRLDYENGGPSVSSDQRQVKGTEYLPVYQINMPSPESLGVLAIITSRQGARTTKKELIEELQATGVIPTYLPSQ
jgi:hypothetical protein